MLVFQGLSVSILFLPKKKVQHFLLWGSLCHHLIRNCLCEGAAQTGIRVKWPAGLFSWILQETYFVVFGSIGDCVISGTGNLQPNRLVWSGVGFSGFTAANLAKLALHVCVVINVHTEDWLLVHLTLKLQEST